MKKLASLICLIFLSVILWGQSEEVEESGKSFQQQIGTDISPLYRNLFKPNLTVNSLLDAPYIFILKSFRNNRAFRLGIGGEIRKEISDDDDDEILQSSLRVRMGFEKQKQISKRWQINSGIDLKFSTSKFDDNNNNNFNNNSNHNSKSFGVSPLLGVQFQLAPHLFLQTEASFNLFYQVSSFESNFDIIFPGPFPGTNSRDFKTFGGNITIPNALLLVVQF
ncbi:MAG: hypothetical protein AB8H03_07225 [Saprospiraceae bacterium]